MRKSVRKTRLLSMVLSFVLVFGTLFTTSAAFAEEGEAGAAAAAQADPPPPTNLRVTEVNHNKAKLEWDFVDGPNDIQIYNLDTGKNITWGNKETRYATGLKPETTYHVFIVWEKDGAGKVNTKDIPEDRWSNVVEFTTPPNTDQYEEAPLSPPSNLRVTDVTYKSISLAWGGSDGANGYDLYVNNAWKTGIWDGTNQVTYQIAPETVTGSVYTFMVGAQNMPKVSDKSNKVTIKWGELAAPVDLQVVSATRTTAALGWAATPGATSYDVYVNGELHGSSEENRYAVSGLTEGSTYDVKVVAKNSLWASPESSSVQVVPGRNYNIVTYYTSWSSSNPGRNYYPSDVDVTQFTHINYAFSDLCWKKFSSDGKKECKNADIPLQNRYVHDGEMIIGDPERDVEQLAAFNAKKAENPNLKLLVSVGGWSWSKYFSVIAANDVTRKAFANSIVKFIRAYKLDGIDIDWEYPVEGGEDSNTRGPEDKVNFGLLVQTVREALDAAGAEDGKYYLQTIAAAQGDNFIVNSDLANSSAYLDFVNIMTYDFSGGWEKLAHHNAPLYFDKNHPRAATSAPRNNVAGSAASFAGSIPNYKVVVGVPFYGKGWSGCPSTGNGQYQECAGVSPGTWEGGILDYQDLEKNYIDKNGYTRYWNDAAKVAYVYNPDTKIWVTYNDRNTMAYTAAMLKSLDIAGVMSWEAHGDKTKTLSTQLSQDLPTYGRSSNELAAPRNLAVTSTGANTISLKWDASAGATGYEVFVNKQWVANTTNTNYTVASLSANTSYTIHVIAVVKDGADVKQVSVNSQAISVKTSDGSGTTPTTPTSPSTGSSSGGTTPAQPAAPTGQLETKVSKDGDKLTVSVPKDAALKAIEQATSPTFSIQVAEKAGQVEVTLPKEVIAAIAKKGDKASVTVNVNGVAHLIPIQSLGSATDVKISIQSPKQETQDNIAKLLNGAKAHVSAFEFKLAPSASKPVSHKFTFQAKDVDANRLTGVIYLPEINEIRSVPTVVTVNADGTVSVEVKSQGNGIYSVIESKVLFTDAIPAWAQEDVLRAAAKLIVFGEGEAKFGAGTEVTRGEIASIIARAFGVLPNGGKSTFTDVAPDSKYANDIAAAKAAGLIQGKSESIFEPNENVTREQLAAILASALKAAGVASSASTTALDPFKDQSSISSYAKDALAMLVEHKILLGVSDTQLAPMDEVTRAQAAVIIMRALRVSGLSN
ncbi:glycosyl hydrolase family 18 protein [Paenibacillus guangzhouensis]|uniref:glycosyl hydrolase family 18 protein n=1 Tax=Paenibacillus guangzhouensis TaxID=1473112 RepID=UPI001D10A1B9|nr:glycosyl hydrolase family 18 protein [Paenibacillus guangzhouensis]